MMRYDKSNGTKLKDIMDWHFRDVKFDVELYKKLKGFRLGWAQKSPDYTDFLGGVLTGVHPIRFSAKDEDDLFIDILGIDLDSIRAALPLDKDIYICNKPSSNPAYLSLVYIMHRFNKSKDIGKYRIDAMTETYYIYGYKVIGGLMAAYFKFETTREIAITTVERLSKRFLLRRVNSWQELFEYRSYDILPKGVGRNKKKPGINYPRIVKFNAINAGIVADDLRDRIKSMVINIYSVMMEVIESKQKLALTSLNAKIDGEDTTAEVVDRPDKYVNYIKSIIQKDVDLIHSDYLHIIKIVLPNLNVDMLRKTLVSISNKYSETLYSGKNDFVTVIIVRIIEYNRHKGISSNFLSNIMEMLQNGKGYLSSSSVKHEDTRHVKKLLYKEVMLATNIKTKHVIANTVIGVMLYIFLRAIAK